MPYASVRWEKSMSNFRSLISFPMLGGTVNVTVAELSEAEILDGGFERTKV